MNKGTTIAAFLAGCAAAATGDARNSRAEGEGIEWGEEIAGCVEQDGASATASIALDFAPFMVDVAESKDGATWLPSGARATETADSVSVSVSCEGGTTALRLRWIEP